VPCHRLRQDADRQCQHQRQRRVSPLHPREPTPPPTSTTRSARSNWSVRWPGSGGLRPPRCRAVCTARCATAGDARSEAADAGADPAAPPRGPSPAAVLRQRLLSEPVTRPGATSVRARTSYRLPLRPSGSEESTTFPGMPAGREVSSTSARHRCNGTTRKPRNIRSTPIRICESFTDLDSLTPNVRRDVP
jgi:hypothetical protein